MAQDSIAAFKGNSYLAYKRLPSSSRAVTIEMQFKSWNNDGLLMYNGQMTDGAGDFISVGITDGFVEFR